ncbi:MAG: tRNA (cytidine(56)-2'-O)-methyltransferase [Candidatus Bathyarchaeia archaeon]|nr:tRNA (cytidine(56)-2'-O)-methyltransferase [Candidatus Bathyarchaeota archaeon]
MVMDEVYVLRWGHRPRDLRVTTHVALVARAFGARGFILSDVEDWNVKGSIEKVVEAWGGPFSFEMGLPWRRTVEEWRGRGGFTVHLTMYGLSLEEGVLSEIRERRGGLLILVGSRKVPGEFFSPKVSDYNVAVGNQPHSEVAALAVFLDRLFKGEELRSEFKDARIKVIPSERGKRVIRLQDPLGCPS